MQEHNDAYHVVWLIRRLFRAMAQKSNESLEDLGISAADRAVMEFLFPGEALSVPEIAQRYQVSRQHIQVTANGLLEAGLLVTQTNPSHKRSSLVTLTTSGKTLFKKIRARDDKIVKQLFSHVSGNELRVTQKTLETLLAQLK